MMTKVAFDTKQFLEDSRNNTAVKDRRIINEFANLEILPFESQKISTSIKKLILDNNSFRANPERLKLLDSVMNDADTQDEDYTEL